MRLVTLGGGKGDLTRPDQVDPTQLSTGIQIEMEHTNDPKIAQEIALDHLTEDPEYYTKLIKAGLADEFSGSASSGLGDPDQSFNDPARVGEDGVTLGNVKGSIGGTSDGQVDGRASAPLIDKSNNPFDGDGREVNKTVDIELQEKRSKRVQAILKKMREGDNSNVNRNPIQVFDGPSPAETSPEGLGTFGSGYDFVGYAENTNYSMKQERLKEIIRALAKQQLREQEEMDGPEAPEAEAPETPEAPEGAGEDQITLTIDRATAQKLHDLLMQVLAPAGEEGGEEEAPTETDDQLPPAEGPIGADDEGEGADESELGEITFEQSEEIEEAKEKWIQKAVSKKGALHKQLHVPKGEKIPKDKLKAAAEKGGKLGKRARLALTLSKLKKGKK